MKTKTQLLNLLHQLKSQIFIVEDQLERCANPHGDEDLIEGRVRTRLYKMRIELTNIQGMVKNHG